MTNLFTLGTDVILSVTAEALNGAGVMVDTDPTTVICRVKAPDGTTIVYTYGVDTALQKDATGVYHLDVTTTQHGTYRYRWEGTGAAQGAEEGIFVVRRSGVV